MLKETIKKLFLLLFLISLFLLCFIELNYKIKNIKPQTSQIDSNDCYIDNVSNKESDYKNVTETSVQLINKNDLLNNEDEEIMINSTWKSINRKDSYNNELQYYKKENVEIGENTIEILSKKESIDNKLYTSGLVESINAYKYGKFEFVISISEGKGLFPAIWLMNDSGLNLPEIDIFEMVGDKPDCFYGVIHYLEKGEKKHDFYKHKVEKKDTYKITLEWDSSTLTWFIDGIEVYKTSKGVPQEYMYIVINQAIGGNWPGNPDDSIFPCEFKILSYDVSSVQMKERN